MNWPDPTVLWLRLLRRIPRGFRQDKRPYVFLFALLMIVLLLIFTVISRYPNTPALFLPMAGLLLLLILAIHKGMPLTPAVHIATAAGATVLMYVIWHSGGVFSPRLGWLMLLPLTPFL